MFPRLLIAESGFNMRKCFYFKYNEAPMFITPGVYTRECDNSVWVSGTTTQQYVLGVDPAGEIPPSEPVYVQTYSGVTSIFGLLS